MMIAFISLRIRFSGWLLWTQ